MSEDDRGDGRSPKGTFAKGKSGNPTGLPKTDRERDPEAYFARRDGWGSALTGIGDQNRDKRMSHTFLAPTLSYQEAIELWRADDIARRAIEAMPRECLREGYELSISDEGQFDDLKEAVEQKMIELEVNKHLFRAMCYERAYGGAAILIGANDRKPLDRPLEQENVTSLDWLTVLEPIELQPLRYYDDPSNAKYGEISHYTLTTNSIVTATSANPAPEGRSVPSTTRAIHESRLVIFPGLKVSRYQSSSNMSGTAWGDSLLLSLVEILRDFNVAWHGAGIIATDFAQPVLSMENLMALVAKEPTKVAARAQALEMQRSTARAVLIDSKEKYERQSTTLAGLPDLLKQLSMRLAAAIDMPLTLLMGQTPEGLGANGDSDVRFYYDRIRGAQKDRVGPILHMFMDMIMRTLRQRKLPKRWGVRFHPLWQLTDEEKANARLAQARVDSMYIKMGALTCDEIRFSRFGGEYSWETQIQENKPAPGIPEIVATAEQAKLMAGMEGDPTKAGGAQGSGGARHGVKGYARRNPVGAKAVVSAAKEGGDVAPSDNRDHADNAETMTLDDCFAARKRAREDGKLTPQLDELIAEVEAMIREDAEISHVLYGGACPGKCIVCDNVNRVKADLEDTKMCPQCGDMMVGEHECGAPDLKEPV